MTAAELFAASLKNEGVRYVFGIPGEETLDLTDAITKAGITFILTHHEQAAAFMAATYGRLTGRAGVCLSTLGPGALNLTTGLAFAALGGMPVVAITAQSGIRDNWKREFQRVNVLDHFRPFVKWNARLENPHDAPYLVRRAFAGAEAHRPGVTHIEVPEDVIAESADGAPLDRHDVRRPAADAKTIAAAADLLRDAKHPLILVSNGAVRKRVVDELATFVTSTNLYVAHTQMGKGTLSDENPHSLFTLGIHSRDWVHCGFEYADAIITLGYHPLEYSAAIWNRDRSKKILHIDFAAPVIDHYYNPAVSVVGDIASNLRMLTDKLAGTSWDTSYFSHLRTTITKQVLPVPSNQFPCTPQTVIAAARGALGKSDIVISDVGAHKIWIARTYPAYDYQTCLIDNGLAAMGGGLPNAIAAAMVFPEKRVLLITGDGGFLMNMHEMATAARLGVKLVVVVWNDGGLGMVRWHAEKNGFRPIGTEFQNPSYTLVAQSFGWKGYRVERAEDLPELLEQAFKDKECVLMDCPIDPSETTRVFTHELKQIICPL